MTELYQISLILISGVILLLIVIKWFIVLPYLWFKYDRKIIKLKNELDNFRNKERRRHTSLPIIDYAIEQQTNNTNQKLDILEIRRRLFLDRSKIFLSILSISNK